MKTLLKIIVSLAAVGVVAVVSFVAFNLYRSSGNETVEQSTSIETVEQPPNLEETDEATPNLARTGTFSGLNDYKTSGEASVQDVDGKQVLTFSSDFKADNGPDLLVYLSKNNVQSGEPLGTFVSLGKLKLENGKQAYDLPEDAATYKSVVIFCRSFNAPFGAADLK